VQFYITQPDGTTRTTEIPDEVVVAATSLQMDGKQAITDKSKSSWADLMGAVTKALLDAEDRGRQKGREDVKAKLAELVDRLLTGTLP